MELNHPQKYVCKFIEISSNILQSSLSKIWSIVTVYSLMGLYLPVDGVANLKYKLLYFLTSNK